MEKVNLGEKLASFDEGTHLPVPLDGFLEVFWYDDPQAGVLASLADLAPQLVVLSLTAVGLLALARVFARRWETV